VEPGAGVQFIFSILVAKLYIRVRVSSAKSRNSTLTEKLHARVQLVRTNSVTKREAISSSPLLSDFETAPEELVVFTNILSEKLGYAALATSAQASRGCRN